MEFSKNQYTLTEKRDISNTIRNITLEDALEDFKKLKNRATNGKKNNIGSICCDYFTFIYRLECISSNPYNFYDLLYNINYFLKKQFIQNFITNNTEKYNNKHENIIFYRLYCMYGSGSGNFNTFFAKGIYERFKPHTTLDLCAGWGSRGVAALSASVNYIGFDTNTDLRTAYKDIAKTLLPLTEGNSIFKVNFKDSATVDFSKFKYDMVFTSPPYYQIEKYNGMKYKTTTEWNIWYNTVFSNSYKYLQPNGVFVLSINEKIYNDVCVPLLGVATEIIPYSSSSIRKYNEFVYVWKKE